MEYLNDPKRKKPELIVVPTAGGKSFILAEITKRWKNPTIILQPGQELLEQNFEKFCILGGQASIFSASLNTKEIGHVTYATLGSIKKVVDKLRAFGDNWTVLIDEAHKSFNPSETSEFTKFINELQPTKVIGLTATPFMLKSSMAGSELKLLTRMKPNYFKGFISIVQIQEIIESGYWSKINYELHRFDESGLRINSSGADYTDESVKAAIKVQGINNNIYLRIKTLLKEGCPSILCFVDCVETAKRMCEFLPDVSAYLDAKMPKKDRNRVVSEYKSGKIKVLFNFGILTTGFDYPDLRCVIMGRPTMSLSLYYQIIGRGTRISKSTGKESFLYIDYCNNVDRFGKVENMTLEEVEGWGMGMFNGEYLLTNCLIGGLRLTKAELSKKGKTKTALREDKIWFGKHVGKTFEELPINYIKFLLYESEFDFSHPTMKTLQTKLKEVLIKSEQRVFSV